MQSLQHHARLTIWNNDVDYSHLPRHLYLSLGLPDLEIIERMRYRKDPDVGLETSAELGCLTSLKFFKSIGANHINFIGSALCIAAKSGHIEIVKQCKEWGGAKSLGLTAIQAAGKGHIDIVVLFKSWGHDVSYCCGNASRNGRYDMVKLFLEWDRDCVNECMQNAAIGGHEDIVRMCRDHGATKFKIALLQATENNHINIIKLYKEWGIVKYFDDAIVTAARRGHIEIVKLCKEYGAVNFKEAYMCAVSFKLQNILKEWKDTHYDWMMIEAALDGDIELLKESKDKGAVAYNKALKWAADRGHIEIITLLKSWGANDFDSAVRKAIYASNLESLKLFKDWKVSINFDKALEFESDYVLSMDDIRPLLLEWRSSLS